MARPQHTSDETIIEALAATDEVTAGNLARRLGIGESTAKKRLYALEAAGAAQRQPGGWGKGRRVADRWSAVTPSHRRRRGGGEAAGSRRNPKGGVNDATVSARAEAGPEGTATSGSERLGRGALGALVRAYLAERPGEDVGPTLVAKSLGRSQGAVANALARLEAAGEARLVSASPRRYRLVTPKH